QFNYFLLDIRKTWERIFDQKGFLKGEINFILREFEEKRGDSEVDNLFKSVETLTDINDTQIYRLRELAYGKIVDANIQLNEALTLCANFPILEESFNQSTLLHENRNKRKDQWEEVMDGITANYSEINREFEQREADLKKTYKNMESKLV
ncbi:biogenesis of lysosome-related organelles complex 1 subunit 5, partial [Euwallacea similis]|uniref:biogenesis of lysosome-related organelles complex 1 subunit 5 n=1 Tax=Euwallacea similis TaxID=1736056 RepID=UPI00344D247F